MLSGQSEGILVKLWALNFSLIKDEAKLQTLRKQGGKNVGIQNVGGCVWHASFFLVLK